VKVEMKIDGVREQATSVFTLDDAHEVSSVLDAITAAAGRFVDSPDVAALLAQQWTQPWARLDGSNATQIIALAEPETDRTSAATITATFQTPMVGKMDSAALNAGLRDAIKVVSGSNLQVSFEATLNSQSPFEPKVDPDIDWTNAPEGATHKCAGGLIGLWYKLDFEANTAFTCVGSRGPWKDSGAATSYLDGSLDDMIARPVVPTEVWSLKNCDGGWDYDSLAELISDNGPDPFADADDANAVGMQAGMVVFRGIKHYDDPGRFVPDEDDVAQYMSDRAQDSDAGEWADNYPDFDKAAEAELAIALEPLKAWARKHFQPTFFTVEDITPYVLTAEDVQ
jgi:hypothetical protein